MSSAENRNPPWSWDEEILAFDLYQTIGVAGPTDEKVVELSKFLQTLPIHNANSRSATFRNPNSVARKLADIHTHQPGFIGKPTSGSRIDRQVWERYGNRLDIAAQLSATIRLGASAASTPEGDEDEVDNATHEGKISYRLHRMRERSSKLRQKKIAQRINHYGFLSCEACEVVLGERYQVTSPDVYECHHLIPLHVSGEVGTKLSDIALLCPNCHRIAHRMVPWPTIAELQSSLNQF